MVHELESRSAFVHLKGYPLEDTGLPANGAGHQTCLWDYWFPIGFFNAGPAYSLQLAEVCMI